MWAAHLGALSLGRSRDRGGVRRTGRTLRAGWNLAIYLLISWASSTRVIDGTSDSTNSRAVPVRRHDRPTIRRQPRSHDAPPTRRRRVRCGLVQRLLRHQPRSFRMRSVFGDVRLVGLLGLSVAGLLVSVVFIGFFASISRIASALIMLALGKAHGTSIPYGVFSPSVLVSQCDRTVDR